MVKTVVKLKIKISDTFLSRCDSSRHLDLLSGTHRLAVTAGVISNRIPPSLPVKPTLAEHSNCAERRSVTQAWCRHMQKRVELKTYPEAAGV